MGMLSPVVYDVTVSNLKGESATDLAVSIDGDKNILNLGDNVKLTITALNRGPRSADVKVDYQIPSALKFLSSNGTGIYDSVCGVWDVGILPAGGVVSLELILQSVVWGSASNIATVYSNLPDLDIADNYVVYDVVVSEQVADIPLVVLPVDPPFNPQMPPGSGGGSGGSSCSSGNSTGLSTPDNQLARDVRGVRDAVTQDKLDQSVIPDWKPGQDETQRGPKDNSDDDASIWVYILTASVVLLGALALKFRGAISEYLLSLWQSITNAMNTLWTVMQYFGVALKDLFIAMIRSYLPPVLSELGIDSSVMGIWNLLNYIKFVLTPSIPGVFFIIARMLAQHFYTIFRIVSNPLYQFLGQMLSAKSWADFIDLIYNYINKK